jgi:hypothetical protein
MIPNLRLLFSRMLAMALVLLLCPLPQLAAQTATQTAAVQAAPLMLHINILDGEGALNNISQRTAREPIVQVEDQNHKPVAGALVLFTIHSSGEGAGGTFVTPFAQTTSLKVTTDANGQAAAHGLTPNTTAGQFTLSVEASVGAVSTTAVIHIANSLLGGTSAPTSSAASSANAGTSSTTSSSTSSASTASTAGGSGAGATATHGILHAFHFIPKWALVGVVGGAAVAVTVVVVTNSSGGASITAGGGTVTGPH